MFSDFSFISLLSWHAFFLRSEPIFYMSCVVLFSFSFTFLSLSFFVLLFYMLVIFLPACIFFFFSTVCSFSHFLCRGGELLSLYFSSSLCWFTNKLLRLSHCAYFFFLPFFSSSLFSHADFKFLYFFLSLSVQSWW